MVFKEGMNFIKNAATHQNGCLPVGLRLWIPMGFCASGHDECAYQISPFYVHVGGGASQ